MMLLKACKWVGGVAIQIFIGAAGGILASVILAHFHLA